MARLERLSTCSVDTTKKNFEYAYFRYPLEGYTNQSSYSQGETIHLYLGHSYDSLGDLTANIEILRYGYYGWNTFSSKFSQQAALSYNPFHWNGGVTRDYREGCGWEETMSVNTDTSWKTGFYAAKISATVNGTTQVGYVPFVIKSSAPSAKMLWVIPTNTYQAYNSWSGGGLYWPTLANAIFKTDTVSFDRPYGKSQDANLDSARHFIGQPVTACDDLGGWNLSHNIWAQYLESEAGYKAGPGTQIIDYCTDYDLHQMTQNNLQYYKAILFLGHCEYWSYQMRQNIKEFIAAGGNVAFFGANTCYWKSSFVPGGRQIIVAKCDSAEMWRKLGYPEAEFIGGQYDEGHVVTRSQIVQDNSHWIFKGTNLQIGNTFGFGGNGYEALTSGEVDDYKPSVSPSNIQVLARTNVYRRGKLNSPDTNMYSAATYYIDQTGNGRVFNGASLGWHGVLYGTDYVTMRTIVNNILNHFSGKTYADSIVKNMTWSENVNVFANTYVRHGKILTISGTVNISIDSGAVFCADGEIKIDNNATVTFTGEGSLKIGSTGTFTVNPGAVVNLVPTWEYIRKA